MKKNILTRLVALLMMALVPLLSLAVNTIIYNATYDFDNLTLGTDTLGGVTYTTVNYDGLFNGGEPGKPSLPVDYIKFSVPYNATNFTVTATLQNNMISNLSSYLVYPCQLARLMNDTTPIVITPPDNNVYNSNSYYPSQNAWVVDEGFLAGENHIVTVAVMPLSYKHRVMGNIKTHQLRKSGTVRLVLSYDLNDTPAMYPIIRKDTTLRQEGYALTRSMVANPDNVLFNAPTDINMNPLDPNGLISGNELNGGLEPPDPGNISNDTIAHDGGELEQMTYPYLIVTTPELKHSLRRLAALKRQKGYNVKIVTMDDVMNHPYACLGDRIKQPDGTYQVAYSDDTGKLRQYLRFAFRSLGTQYVLLAGNGVPYRKITMRITENENTTAMVPSDLYLFELNADWNKNEVSFLPEIFGGRIIAKGNEQINNYTDKLLRYELNPGRGDYSYLKRALYSAGYDLIIGAEVYNVRRQMDNVFPVHFEISELNSTPNRPSGDSIISVINANNFGFISLHHHGFPSGLIASGYRQQQCHDYLKFLWAVNSAHIFKDYESRENDDPSTTNGLDCLNNKWFPSIGYSTGCTTMPFDTINGYESIPMNFGESFTTGKDYGGPAFLGNTRDGYTPRTGFLESAFCMELKNGYYKIGMANSLAKPVQYVPGDTVAHDYSSVCQNLLGDPELEIWTDLPQTYNGINITRTDSSLTVTGINVDSTIVSYCDNAGGIRKKTDRKSVV